MSQLNFDADPNQPMSPGMAPGPGPQQPVPVTRKQGLNVYTVMLIISALCMMTAAILFYMELSKFDDWWNTDSQRINASLTDVFAQSRDMLASVTRWIRG